jgi:hypothetical protein
MFHPRLSDSLSASAPGLAWLILAVLASSSSLRADDIFDYSGAAKYLEKLEKAVTLEDKSEPLYVRCRAIRDVYEYEILRSLVAAQKRGVKGDRLGAHLAKVHKKQKANRGKTLLLIDLNNADNASFCFLSKKLKLNFIDLKRGKKRLKKRLITQDPKLKYEKWKVMVFPKGKANKSMTRKLAVINEWKIGVQIDDLDAALGTPFTLTVQGLWNKKKSRTRDRKDSINTRVKQLSFRDYSDVVIPPIKLELHPKEWKTPKRPKRFRKILEFLSAK